LKLLEVVIFLPTLVCGEGVLIFGAVVLSIKVKALAPFADRASAASALLIAQNIEMRVMTLSCLASISM